MQNSFQRKQEKKLIKLYKSDCVVAKCICEKWKKCHYQCPAERRVDWTIPNCDKELTTIPGLPREKLRKGYKVAWVCLACQKVGVLFKPHSSHLYRKGFGLNQWCSSCAPGGLVSLWWHRDGAGGAGHPIQEPEQFWLTLLHIGIHRKIPLK